MSEVLQVQRIRSVVKDVCIRVGVISCIVALNFLSPRAAWALCRWAWWLWSAFKRA